MISAIDTVRQALPAIEAQLGALHEVCAQVRDAAPKGFLKAEARSMGNQIEKALQALERIS